MNNLNLVIQHTFHDAHKLRPGVAFIYGPLECRTFNSPAQARVPKNTE